MKLYEKMTNNHLIHIIRKGLQCEGMPSFLWLALIFLYTSIGNTSSNYFKGMIPIPWMQKNLCTRFGLTWSNSTPLHINSKNETLEKQKNNRFMKQTKNKMYLFKLVMVVNNFTSLWDVLRKIKSTNMWWPRWLIVVQLVDVRHWCLHTMVTVPYKTHFVGKAHKVWVVL
jgi:hypothetical protein